MLCVMCDCYFMTLPAEALRNLQKANKIVDLDAGRYNETQYGEEAFQSKSEFIEATFFENECTH